MKSAAESAEEWNVRDRDRVDDAKRNNRRPNRRGDKCPHKALGFHGLSILFMLPYFNFARGQTTDCFHHVVGVIKAVFGLILNHGAYKFTKKRREYCVNNQGALKKLRPTRSYVADDGKRKRKIPIPSWQAKNNRITTVDHLIDNLRWYDGACSEMKRVNTHWASMKGHDWANLASDAGVYLVKMYRISRNKTKLLCSLLRVCENVIRPTVSRKELPSMFEQCVRTLTRCEIELPLYLCSLVLHKLIHVFAHQGYIYQLN